MLVVVGWQCLSAAANVARCAAWPRAGAQNITARLSMISNQTLVLYQQIETSPASAVTQLLPAQPVQTEHCPQRQCPTHCHLVKSHSNCQLSLYHEQTKHHNNLKHVCNFEFFIKVCL